MTNLAESMIGFTEDGKGMTKEELAERKKKLAVHIALFEEADEERANPYHSKKDGKFTKSPGSGAATKGSGPVSDYAAITPGKGSTVEGAVSVMSKTPDGKRLTTVTKNWQGKSGEVEKIQADFMVRANGKKTRSGQRDAQMDVLKDGIKNAPPTDRALYRGQRVASSEGIDQMVGKSFVIPPSSFSSEERIARQFVDRSQTNSTTIIYRMPAGKGRALPVELYGDPKYAYEKESISAGQFKVTSVEKQPGNKGYILDIEHTAMFDWGG